MRDSCICCISLLLREERDALGYKIIGQELVCRLGGVDAIPKHVASGVGARPRRVCIAKEGRLYGPSSTACFPRLEEPCRISTNKQASKQTWLCM